MRLREFLLEVVLGHKSQNNWSRTDLRRDRERDEKARIATKSIQLTQEKCRPGKKILTICHFSALQKELFLYLLPPSPDRIKDPHIASKTGLCRTMTQTLA